MLHGQYIIPRVTSADVERGSPMTSCVSIVAVNGSNKGLFLDFGFLVDGKPMSRRQRGYVS